MRPLISTWPYGAIYWIIFVCAYLPEALLNRRSRPLLGVQDARSERALAEILGEPYRAYMARTKRFIPKLV